MTAYLSVDDAIRIHDGNVCGEPLLDRRKLEGAMGRPQTTFDGVMMYSSIYSQAAVLLHGIATAHAFLDGNKRTAWLVTIVFLEINGIIISDVSPETMSDYVEQVAKGVHETDDIAFWFAGLDPQNERPL